MFWALTEQVQIQLITLAGSIVGLFILYLQKRFHVAEMKQGHATQDEVKTIQHALGISAHYSKFIDMWDAQARARLSYQRAFAEEAMRVDPELAIKIRTKVADGVERLLTEARLEFEAAHPEAKLTDPPHGEEHTNS